MGDEEAPAKTEIDLVNRDPNELNGHLKVGFDDVLGEPEHAHSMDCVWSNSYKCFTCGKNCCYKLVTALSGICIALYWGCVFACVAFENVWCLTPCLKLYNLFIGLFSECFTACCDCCCGTCFKAIGYMFSRIQVQQG